MALEENNKEQPATSSFFMLPSFVLSLIEQILNQALKLDPSLHDKLNVVEHQRLLVEVRDWQQKIVITYANQQLHLYTALEHADADCMISATIDTLLALKNPAMMTQLIRQNKLDLEGDLNIAQNYSSAFSSVDIDWPEQLDQVVGKVLQRGECGVPQLGGTGVKRQVRENEAPLRFQRLRQIAGDGGPDGLKTRGVRFNDRGLRRPAHAGDLDV